MQKSFVVKATLCIEECQFYLRAGDVLMYDTVAHRLNVYRANAIVKTLDQTPISVAGFVKAGMFQEVSTPAPVAVPAPPKPAPAVAAVQPVKPSPKVEVRKKPTPEKLDAVVEITKKAWTLPVPKAPVDMSDAGAPALREE